MISINGHQLKELLDFIDSDDEVEVCLHYYSRERRDEESGEMMLPGLYAWMSEYPEEGQHFLAESPTPSA